jgi:catecholate siderophore receptor
VRVDGFEVSATGRITENRNLIAGGTRLGSEIARSNNRAEAGREFADVAPDTFPLWTTCNLPHGVQIGGGATFVGRRHGNTTNTVRAPGYLRYDAAIAWEPGDGPMRGLRCRRNALNLGDARIPGGGERGSARQTAGESCCRERGRAERRCPPRRPPLC